MKTKPIFYLSLICLSFILLLSIKAVLAGEPKPSGEIPKLKGIRTFIVGGGSSHDFDRWYKQADVETLEKEGLATVTYTSNTDSIVYYLPQTDVLYLSNNQPINDPQARKAILDFVNNGKGLILGHAALWYNWADWPEYNQQLVSGGTRSHDRYGRFDVNITNSKHPVTKKIAPKFSLKDELYHYQKDPSGPGIEILATGSIAGSDKVYPLLFVIKNSKARIVGLTLGHDAESHSLPAYQNLLRNAVRWVAKK